MRPGGAPIWLALLIPATALAEDPPRIVAADYAEPTMRYAHGVLGDAVEWGALRLTVETCADCPDPRRAFRLLRLPPSRVFEDTAPRLVDADGDGRTEALVVESDTRRGARLALYDEGGLVAATDPIGQAYRWLAPVGVADLDGDGRAEIAYVDRPHVVRELVIVRREGARLNEIARMPGVTNHRIGDRSIAGGIRDCGQGPEMIVLDPDWSRIQAVRFDGRGFTRRDLAPSSGRSAIAAALAC